MPFDPANLTNYSLFKYFWTADEPGLARHGLDEITPEGATKLKEYALEHNLDGTKSPAADKKIDADEKALMKSILADNHYGAFFEQDARPLVMQNFGIDAGSFTPPPLAKHPVDAGAVTLPNNVSKWGSQLGSVDISQLPGLFQKELSQRKAYFNAPGMSKDDKSVRLLGLLADYSNALWSRGEQSNTEQVGNKLLDAFFAHPASKAVGAKDFNGAGWSVAQSLVLGLDPNEFEKKFPEAGPKTETTYLSMDGAMAKAMSYVDAYREALGKDKKAEEFENKSPLGWMIGDESGHKKRGNLDEKKAFSSSGLNWGVLMFPNDAEIKKLPPKKDFDFAIDCIDGFGNSIQAKASWGDRIVVKDENGNKLKMEKVIHKEGDKPVSWSAVFKNNAGEVVEPSKVLGVIVNSAGQVKGDGKATRSLDMWWWGFCDRNTAQRLYKSKYNVPQIDRDTVKIKAGDKTISIPKAEAQKLIDADIPDIVTGETFCGFRFNDEPQQVKLKTGEVLEAKVKDLSLDAGPGTTRLGEDMVAVHDAPKRPMLGTVEVEGDGDTNNFDVRYIKQITKLADGKVKIEMKDDYPGWPQEMTGKLLTDVPWNKASTVDGKKVLKQSEDFVIRGGFTLELLDGSTRRVTASQVSQIVGEAQADLRLSSFLTWVSENKGMFATDGSTGIVVSNGMRWVNKFDIHEEKGDTRPEWAGEGTLTGINGAVDRQAGDKMVWVRAMYKYNKESDADSSAFEGWLQVSKDGRILNEGFLSGQPDFGWGANGKLNWLAQSSFNPYMEPDMRLKIFVNGVKDEAKLKAMADAGNLPANWKSYKTPQD